MKTPCMVTINGESPTCDKEWDNFGDAVRFCTKQVEHGKATHYKIECVYGVFEHTVTHTCM